jgi:hypothetical protein
MDHEPLGWRRWLARCGSCFYAKIHEADPNLPACPKCGVGLGPDEGFSVEAVAVPKGFRTDFSRGEDAKEEPDLLLTGSSSVAESDQEPPSHLASTNSSLGFSGKGRVFKVNNRLGQLFSGSGGVTTSFGSRTLADQWIDVRFQAPEGSVQFQAAGSSECVALISPKTTDVVRFGPTQTPVGILLDPFLSKSNRFSGPALRAAYYSAAFMVRSVAAGMLDIDPEELDISTVRRIEQAPGHFAGEIVISDHLPNGAGFAGQIHTRWQELLDSIVNASPGDASYIGAMISPEHIKSCDSSCPDCLRHYRNMSYHGLLDWRLGLALLRVFKDVSYSCGLYGDFSDPEIAGWPKLASDLRDVFCSTFGCTPIDFGALRGFAAGEQQVVVVHPLWDWTKPAGNLAVAMASVGADTKLQFLDTFNMQRRMSWAYQALGG